MTQQYLVPPHWPAAAPTRLAARVRVDSPNGCRVALLGLPDDLGVRLNQGRPGAAQGPRAFRAALTNMGTSYDGQLGTDIDAGIFDAGDVEPAPGSDASALEATHARVERAASHLQRQGLITVCIGGGHDLSLPSIAACAKHQGVALGGINLDAHLDVRQRVGSGMPFRALIEQGYLEPKRFVELGLGRYANEEDDVRWLAARGATLVFAETLLSADPELTPYLRRALRTGPSFVSIDLDVLDQSVAPGVSAMNACGLGVAHAAKLARAAGRESQVRHFDLMELCPPEDQAQRTARVAAFLFLCFLSGLSERTP